MAYYDQYGNRYFKDNGDANPIAVFLYVLLTFIVLAVIVYCVYNYGLVLTIIGCVLIWALMDLYDIIDSRRTGIKLVGVTYWSLILAPIAILAAIVYVLYDYIGYLFELTLAYFSAYWLVASIAVVLIYVLFRLKFIGLGLFALLCGTGWYFASDVTPYVDALVDKSSQARIAYLKSNKYSILHETKKALSQDNKSINLSNREKTIQIQRILIKNGYKLKADGVFGKKTISATKKFTGLNSADLNTLYIAVKNKADGKKN